MAQIILDSNNNLIQGDFDNATLNNRTKLQTTTTNATTNVYVAPNGSSTSAGVSVANNSSLTNASKIVMATNGTTDTQIISGVNGSGTYLPLSFYTNNALAMQLNTTETTFYTGGTERMRIDSSGNVGIGVTAVDSRTHIYKTVASGDVLRVQNATGSTGVAYVGFRYGTGTGTETGYISTNGTTTTYSTSSDYRLKENIVPMTGALDKVAQLKPVTYKWKLDGSNGQGFIAHELQEIIPDCVTGEKDAVETYTDEKGNEQTRPKYQGIDTSFLVATLTAAIQEQQTIINELKTRIEALESK